MKIRTLQNYNINKLLTFIFFLFLGFTTKRPESFEDAPCTPRPKRPLSPNAILSDHPADVDLYVASTNKVNEKTLKELFN